MRGRAGKKVFTPRAFRVHVVQRRQLFLRHVPPPQHLVDRARGEPAATSRRITRAVSFSFSGFGCVFGSGTRAPASLHWFAVTRINRFLDQLCADSLPLQVLLHAPRAQLLVLLPQPRVGLGKGPVVEVAMLLEPRNRRSHRWLAALALLGPRRSSAAAAQPPCASAAPAPSPRSHTAPLRSAAARLAGCASRHELLASSF